MAYPRWLGELAGIALLALPSCGSGSPPPTTRPNAPPPAPSAPVAEPEPFWQPISSPPILRRTAAYAFEIPAGVLVGDRGGGRHFRAVGEETKSAPRLDPSPHAVLLHVPDYGLVTSDRDGKIRRSPEPLGPLEVVSETPEGAELDSLRAHRGGFTIGTVGGAMFSRDLVSWQPLSRLGDRPPHRALVGADGAGFALFTPQALAATKDGGKTWAPIDDAGVLATTLRSAGDEILVEPGGVTDAYYRSWNPGQKTLARALSEPADPPWTQPIERFDAVGSSLDHAGRVNGRHTSLEGLLRGRAGLLGDVMVYVHKGALGTRPLGGALVWEEIDELASLGQCERIETCGDRLAIACHEGIWLQEGTHRRVVWGETPISMGFTGPDEIVLTTKSGIQWIDLTSSNPVVLPLEAVPKAQSYDEPKVHGTCASTAGAWIETHGAFFRYAGKGGGATRAGDLSFEYDSIIGTHPSGSPLFAADAGHAKQRGASVLGYFDVEGFRELELPFDPMRTHGSIEAHLESFELGRGMLLDAEGGVHVTVDAGKSWVEADAPPSYEPASTVRRVACGATRCEIEDVAVSVGWQVSKSTPAAQPAPKLELELVCEAADPAVVSTDYAGLLLTGIDFGVGSALFSTTLQPDLAGIMERTEAPPLTHEVFVLHGHADGSAQRARLTRTSSGQNILYGFQPFVRMGAVAIAASPVPSTLSPLSVGWQGGAGAPVRTTKFGQGLMPRSSVAAALATPDGFALLDRLSASALWVNAQGLVGMRAWPSREIPTETFGDYAEHEHTHSSLVAVADGRWLAFVPDQGIGRLVSIAEDGYATSRPRLVTGAAATLTVADGKAHLVSVEVDRDGTHALRARPVLGELRLGDAVPLQGGRLDHGDLTSLAPCTADSKGVLRVVELGEGRARIGAGTDHLESVEGQVLAQLQITPTSACIRRVMIRGAAGRVVAMGGGQGAAAWQREVPEAEVGRTVASLLDCRRVSPAGR